MRERSRFTSIDPTMKVASSCSPVSPQPNVLAELYLEDPEFSCAQVSHDLIDFAAGRNTVCRASSLRRCRSDSRLLTSIAPAPLPPPRPFRRSGTSNRRAISHSHDDSLLNLSTVPQNNNSYRWPSQEMLFHEFDEDLFMFLFTAEAVN